MTFEKICNMFPNGNICVVGEDHAKKAAVIAKHYGVKFKTDGDVTYVDCPDESLICSDLAYDEETLQKNLDEINAKYGSAIMIDDIEF